MPATLRVLLASTLVAVLPLAGCAQDTGGTPVSGAGGPAGTTAADAAACTPVSAALADIPPRNDGEPQLRIPVPSGWERNSAMDSQIIRYAIVADDLTADGFATNAVVTLESASGSSETPDEIFTANRDNLVTMMGATDMSTRDNTTCELPSETTDYTAPAMGPAPQRPVIMHAVVAEGDEAAYLATLTIQTAEPDDPAFRSDARQILDGFQMVLPAS